MKQRLRFVTALALVLGLVVLLCGSASANKSRIASDEEMLSALAEMREKEAVGFKLSLTKKYWFGRKEIGQVFWHMRTFLRSGSCKSNTPAPHGAGVRSPRSAPGGRVL